MLSLTPLQLLEAKFWGVLFQIVGLFFACVMLFVSGFGFFLLFLLATIFLCFLELVSVSKQINGIKRF